MADTATNSAPAADDAIEPVVARRRKVEEADMDITPMIDMTFLLLIFFMVSSKIAAKAGIQLPKAKHGAVVGVRDAIQLTVRAADPFPQVFKGDSPDDANLIAAPTVEAQEEQIAAYIEAEAASSKKEFVLIQAEKGLKHRDVARVEKAAARAGLDKMYIGVLEKR